MGVPETSATVDNYKIMRNAGFNISLIDFEDLNSAKKALDNAAQADMKLILMFPGLLTNKDDINAVKNHKALFGYYIADEPSADEFDFFEKRIDQIRKSDNSKDFYVNLHPNYASETHLKARNYNDYLKTFASKSSVQFLSFDNYPITEIGIRSDWYNNLENIRTISKQFRKKFWAFANTTIHDNYPQPTVSSLKLQQFSNLLYGAKGLQYFRYWGHSKSEMEKFNIGNSIVDDKGRPTPTYDIVKTVNEQIQRLGWVFSGTQSDAVYHTGKDIPPGTHKLTSIPKEFKLFSTKGKNALVSLMSNNRNKFILIQNKSLDENIVLEYQLRQSGKKIENTSGKLITLTQSKLYKDLILPGDILIFVYNN